MKNTKKFNKSELIQKAEYVGCTQSQAEDLWNLLNSTGSWVKNFHASNLLYYLGGLITLCALTLFLGMSSLMYGDTCLFVVSLIYALTFYITGLYLWKVKQSKRLGGLSCLFSLLLFSIATYAFQTMIGWWPLEDLFPTVGSQFALVDRGWFLMKLVLLIGTLITLHFVRFPSLTVLLYAVIWLMTENISPFFARSANDWGEIHPLNTLIRLIFSCGFIVTGFLLDRKNKGDFAFWGYLLGASLLWGNLSFMYFETEWGYSIYCLVNILFLGLWIKLKHKVFVILGVLGILNYLMQLFFRYFAESGSFPVVLSFIGMVVIGFGILMKKNIKNSSSKQAEDLKSP